MGNDFDQLMKDIRAEAEAEGPEAVRQADDFDARYAFANQLITARKEQGLTQKDLAKKSGIEQPMISNYERGVGNPTLDTIAALSRSLGGHGPRLI